MHIVVIGAGISGLSTAYFLKQKYGPSVDITLLEKSQRVGGWIQTIREGSFIFDIGPRSCRTANHGIDTLELALELEMASELLPAATDAKERFLFFDGSLHPLPQKLHHLFSRKWLWKFIPALLKEPFRQRGSPHQEETVAEFFTRRFSPIFTELLIDPMVKGIFAGDPYQLSLKACFPKIYQWEQSFGSVIRGILKSNKQTHCSNPKIDTILKRGLFSFRKGMQSLVDRLEERIKTHIRFNSSVEAIELGTHASKVHLNDQTLICSGIIATIPSHDLIPLLVQYPSLKQEMIIPARSVITAHVGYKKIPKELNGFGYLVPEKEKSPILGTVWDSSVFPQQNHDPEELRMTIMMKEGCEDPQMGVREALEKHMKISQPPDTLIFKNAQQAIPQYLPGHHKILRSMQTLSPQLVVAGNHYLGVSVNECIHHAKKIAHNLKFGLIASESDPYSL
ncbi:MAG: protoporphyrinogen oxidase [Chlamydiales bacterium]